MHPNPSQFLISIPHPATCLSKLILKKQNNKQKTYLAPPSLQKLFIHPRGIGSYNVSHSVPLVSNQLYLPQSVHCNESLVWFKASGLWSIIIMERSSSLLSDILWLPQVMEVLQLLMVVGEWGQLFCYHVQGGAEPALLGSVRDRAGSAGPSELNTPGSYDSLW